MTGLAEPSLDASKDNFNLQIILSFGGFSGVVTALMNLLQGDVLASILLPLLWSVGSIILLFLCRITAAQKVLRWVTVLFYNFVMFPLEWYTGHGMEGPVILYYVLLMIVIALLLKRVDSAIFVGLIFTALTVLLMFLQIDGEMLRRFYNTTYERRFDLFFNMLLVGVSAATIIMLLHQRIVKLETELAKVKTLDGVTGLFNKKRILELVKSELLRASRQEQQLSLVLLCIESYSDVERHMGEHSADLLVKHLAYILRSKSRLYDYVGRLSPSCFMCILAGSSVDDAKEYSERICEEFTQIDKTYVAQGCAISTSILDASELTHDQVLSEVDEFCINNQ